ncbi:MAG TPA: TonB-dependent receptor [Candidatus Bathyarchaeia archaeon]|nr:TonB-dependent receptor [Candidatus Bathyarchaeia archaeon]
MRRWLLLLPFLLFPPPLSLAADEDDADTHVVVTATRLDDRPAPVAELPASVTVLDREAIERSGARTIQDLLAEQAGIIVYDQVGNDVEKTLDLRGFTAGHGIAVFLDGARINDPRNNAVALEQVPLAAIERIEITRGSSAAVAGGGAEAGVVRIVTRRGSEPEASISVAAGTYDTLRLDGSYGRTFGAFDVFAAATHDTTDGFRTNADGSQTRADATAGMDLGGDRRLALSLLWSDLGYGNPGALTIPEFESDPWSNVYNVLDRNDRRTTQAALNFQGPIAGGFSLAANLSYRDETTQTLSTGRAAATFGGFFLDADGSTWSGTAQATRSFSARGTHVLSFGFEGLDGDVDSLGYFTSPASPGSYDPESPSSSNAAGSRSGALFAQDAWSPSARWTLVAGVRGDHDRVAYDESIPDPSVDDDRTFSEVSWRGGVSLRPSDALDLHVSFADGFLPPTPEQLFAFPGFGSNPGLDPQDSRTYELGAAAHGSRGTVDAAIFWIDTRDEIAFDPTPTATDPFGRNVNAGATRRQGVELTLRGRLARRVLAFGTWTYTDAEFQGGADDGRTVPLVPKQRFAAGIDAGLPAGFSLRADGLYVGDQVLDNDAANAQPELPAYTVVNLRLSWERAFSKSAGSRAGRIGAFVEARNALDEIYATRGIFAFDFTTFTDAAFVTPAPGRRYLLGVSWKL